MSQTLNLDQYFLCGIGAFGEIRDWQVGRYDEKRDSFSFSNGSYAPMELSREPRGDSATYVIIAVSLQEIDDQGILKLPGQDWMIHLNHEI